MELEQEMILITPSEKARQIKVAIDEAIKKLQAEDLELIVNLLKDNISIQPIVGEYGNNLIIRMPFKDIRLIQTQNVMEYFNPLVRVITREIWKAITNKEPIATI